VAGTEPAGLGIDPEYHASGKAAEDTLDVMQRLWNFRDGDPEYTFSIGHYSGTVKRRVMPAPYTQPHPTVIRTAIREPAIVRAAQLGLPAFLGVSALIYANRFASTAPRLPKRTILPRSSKIVCAGARWTG
jgi:alkanesulfonate monooxygenase SsuD/methylene tetrahydromethanopterin reductase-like flavin-dependent oxidoreductase (luciferase family)